MPINLLAISVGNTRTRFGVFVEDKLIHSHALGNTELQDQLGPLVMHAFAHIEKLANPVILLASVNPAAAHGVEELIAKQTGQNVLRVEQDMPIPIGRKLDPEAIVGEDRLLNAAAAYDVLKQACVVVDAGTAITVDFIDGAGTFHGGAIGPGAQTMLDSLHARTAQLPEVPLARPEEPIGHNTVEAMRSAVFFGLRGMVRELVEQYAEVAEAFPTVIATGGDADLLFKDFDLIDRIVPDLTLLGLAVTYRAALSEETDTGEDDEADNNQ